jgi:hypothetical protein
MLRHDGVKARKKNEKTATDFREYVHQISHGYYDCMNRMGLWPESEVHISHTIHHYLCPQHVSGDGQILYKNIKIMLSVCLSV